MLFTTPTQFAVLGLVLIAGWLLGLASHPGGRKWRERYAAEREAHAAARTDADTRVAEADRRTADAERRATEAERNRAAAPVAAERPLVDDRGYSRRPMASGAAQPAYAGGERRGWFDWGQPVR